MNGGFVLIFVLFVAVIIAAAVYGALAARTFAFKAEGGFFSLPPSVRDVPNVDFATS
jgi:hypothetical protein